MHELSLMDRVRELVLAQAREHGASHITAMTLRIGSLAGVDPEALRFAHGVVMADTIAAGSRLQLEVVVALCQCGPCGTPFEAADGVCVCPICGAISGELLQGRELELASLELD
ncbi:MAG: hydrogenase maturation nickel metallochaperone HypA [Cyanobium sp.]